MNTLEIGRKLVELCRAGRNAEVLETLSSPDIVSVEAGAPPGGERTSNGRAAVHAKQEWWRANHEVHAASANGPWPHDDRFIVHFNYDVTFKPSGQRMQLDETALYTVRDGKIVREEFFYSMG